MLTHFQISTCLRARPGRASRLDEGRVEASLRPLEPSMKPISSIVGWYFALLKPSTHAFFTETSACRHLFGRLECREPSYGWGTPPRPTSVGARCSRPPSGVTGGGHLATQHPNSTETASGRRARQNSRGSATGSAHRSPSL